MTDAEKAYAEAEAQIAKVIAEGGDFLNFSNSEFYALTQIPPQIAQATEVRALFLTGTQVTDLTPIAGLTGITALYLDRTQVTDLTPIAGMTGITTLSLDDTQVTDLTPIAGMTGMTTLDLGNTQVTDLTPIADMTGITSLDLGNTQVTDLTTIAGMNGIRELWLINCPIADFGPLALMEGLTVLDLEGTGFTDLTQLPRSIGFDYIDLARTHVADLRPLRDLRYKSDASEINIHIKDTPATRADPRLAEIAEIENDAERSWTLLDYLKDWVPPIPAESLTAPSFEVLETGQLQSVHLAPDHVDSEQEDLQSDLKEKAQQLHGLIGQSNELAYLGTSVQRYRNQIGKPLADLRLSALYSAANTLRVAYEAHQSATEDGRTMECLPPQCAAALQDVVETHALFFMGFPNAAEVHQKMLAGLTGHRQPEAVALAKPIVDDLHNHPEVLDPEDQGAMADDLAAAGGEGPSAEIGERRVLGGIGNMLVAVGRFVYRHKGKIATSLAGGTLATLKYFVAKEAEIYAWLVTYQGPLAAWFKTLVETIKPWL